MPVGRKTPCRERCWEVFVSSPRLTVGRGPSIPHNTLGTLSSMSTKTGPTFLRNRVLLQSTLRRVALCKPELGSSSATLKR